MVIFEDFIFFYGYCCDGLVVGFVGLKIVFYEFFFDFVIDCISLWVVSKFVFCFMDVIMYMIGVCYFFNIFYIIWDIFYLFIV